MDYISEIKALAQEGLRRDPTYSIFGANRHKWQFGEPVNMQKISDFESDMKITLPKTANLPVMLDHSMTDEQWIDFAKNMKH